MHEINIEDLKRDNKEYKSIVRLILIHSMLSSLIGCTIVLRLDLLTVIFILLNFAIYTKIINRTWHAIYYSHIQEVKPIHEVGNEKM